MPNWRELFEPRIVSIGGGTIWVRGFERDGRAAVVQEWRLDVQLTSVWWGAMSYASTRLWLGLLK